MVKKGSSPLDAKRDPVYFYVGIGKEHHVWEIKKVKFVKKKANNSQRGLKT